ncbi:MAG: ATP-binding protein, partial [Clostridia bacterium]|nr:ATP-binding protein [Clostridia bacterium]
MEQIRLLPKEVSELVAAGEVVERPASVVKELMENCVDAGATSVTVEIRNGGISYLRVTDNGCGIAPDQVPKAFLRHATSKISTASDLDSIGTLGFRGEALASICAVSKVELMTKKTEFDLGCRAVVMGGELLECYETGCPNGTTVLVRDLFYNVPARLKFLRK